MCCIGLIVYFERNVFVLFCFVSLSGLKVSRENSGARLLHCSALPTRERRRDEFMIVAK